MREIIIVKENISKIKAFLEKEHIDYEIRSIPEGQIYQEPLNQKKHSVFANYGEAMKDKEREKEAQELENDEEEDIVNEEW